MKITGLTSTEVDDLVRNFSALMRSEMKKCCKLAADDIVTFNAVITADGELSSAVDAIAIIPTQWEKSVTADLLPHVKQIYEMAAAKVAAPLGDVTPVKATDFLADMENMITSFSSDLWDTAKASLIAGAQDGESIAELAARVENVAQIKAKKAHVIAQTTIIAAVNGGEWQQMMEAASAFDMVVTKEWVSTHDTRTRLTHEAADGQVVPLNEKFVVGDSLLDFPGDPNGDPSEIISCRCTTVYDAEPDEPITASQTSLEPQTWPLAVDTNGLEMASLTAAFNEKDHPRGKDGKFIKSSVVGGWAKAILAGKYSFHDLVGNEKKELIKDLAKIKPEIWHNLKEEQQQKLTESVIDAVDEGIPGSAHASMHLDELDDAFNGDDDELHPDVFNPNTSLPEVDTSIPPHLEGYDEAAKNAKKILDEYHHDGALTDEQFEMFQKKLWNSKSTAQVEMIDDAIEITAKKWYDARDEDTNGSEDGEAAYNDLIGQINTAKKSGKITTDQAEELKYDLDNTGDFEAVQEKIDDIVVSNKTHAPLTTGSSTPVKITHGLIHAKHAPGTTIAVSTTGTHIVWNGTSYDINGASGNGDKGVKKSKLYALLNSKYKMAEWNTPGKQETEVSHVSHLDAAPPVAPIPHPVASPAVVSGLNTTEIMSSLKTGTAKPGDVIAVGSVGNKNFRLVVAKHSSGKSYISKQEENSLNKGNDDWEENGKIFHKDDFDAALKSDSTAGLSWVAPSPKKASPFQILEDTGANGDGYAAPGLWGKYGAAGVMIKNTDANGVERFLMVQRGPMVSSNKGKWQLAGGALNSKETPEQGAAREIFEEIGAPQEYLETMQPKGTHAVEVPIPSSHGGGKWRYSNIAAEAPTMFDPKIDGTETGDAKWLTKEEIQKLVDDGKMHPAVAKALPSVFALYDTSDNNESGSPNVNVPSAPISTAPQSLSTPSVAQTVDLSGWKKIGGQTGSNKGAMYEDAAGKKYYVKSLKSQDHAKNEVLAAALYRAAGIDAPEVRHGENHPEGWSNVIISPIVPNATQKHNKYEGTANAKFKQDTQDGFLVDVWLANHDVIGQTEDNIVVSDGKPWRIDVGGALEYRAMGDKKTDWGKDPMKSYNGMKSKTQNYKSFKVFGDMTDAQEKESAKKLLPLTDAKIDQMVKDAGMPSSLGDTLKARRKAILDKYDLNGNDSDTTHTVITPDVVPAPEPTLTSDDEDTLAKLANLNKAYNKGLMTSDEYHEQIALLQNGPSSTSVIPSGATLTTDQLVVSAIDIGHVPPLDGIIAKGKSPKFANADYAYAFDASTQAQFMYKTHGQPWKPMSGSYADAAKNAQKMGVVWTPTTTPESLSDDELTTPSIPSPLPSAPPHIATSHTSAAPMYSHHVVNLWKNSPNLPADTPIAEAKSSDGTNYTVSQWHDSKQYLSVAPTGETDGEILSSTEFANFAEEHGIEQWHVPGDVPNTTPSVATPAAPVSAPTTTVADLTYAQKANFYSYFKNEKVSPAWSAAKIYKSMHVAKQKMSGDSKIAAMNDAQMLELIDKMHWASKPGMPVSAYSEKVKDWLKTPNGLKSFKELNPSVNPATIAPSSGGYAPWKSAPAKKLAKKAVPATSASKTYAEILASKPGGSYPLPPSEDLYNAVKAQSNGNSVKSPPVELFQTLHKIASQKGVSVEDVITAMDVETAKKYPSVSHTYKQAMFDWLHSLTGAKVANSIINGTYGPPVKKVAAKKAKKGGGYGGYGGYGPGGGSSGSSSTSAFSKDLPLDQKVKDRTTTVPPFDPTKKYDPKKKHDPTNDFPVVDHNKAKALWTKWNNEQGVMTEVQKTSLKYYTTTSGAHNMNSYLRGQQGASTATQQHVNNAQAGMKLSTEPMVFHRGNGWFDGWKNIDEVKSHLGTNFPQEAFFSTSIGGKSAFSGAINFIIEAPPGTPMAYVKGFSHYGSEDEMLLGANVTYRVMSVHETDIDGSWHYGTKVTVVLRVVPHGSA